MDWDVLWGELRWGRRMEFAGDEGVVWKNVEVKKNVGYSLKFECSLRKVGCNELLSWKKKKKNVFKP